MNQIGFFTPVFRRDPQTLPDRLAQGLESYFYLGGRIAYVIEGNSVGKSERVELLEEKERTLYVALKVISYATVILPAVAIVLKAIYRATHSFHIDSAPPAAAQVGAPQPALAPVVDLAPELVQGAAEPARLPPLPVETVQTLMEVFVRSWKAETRRFQLNDWFNKKKCIAHLNAYAERFGKKDVEMGRDFGFIDKVDLDPQDAPVIYMRADLHGDLKSLIENLRTLQKEGHLDDQFRCKKGVHLIFLGDYSDRGFYGIEILELLMRLREENPDQVHLIRGNHEYLNINQAYGYSDINLRAICEDDEGKQALTAFYETMSLTTYFGLIEGSRTYIQCTHGLFEPTMDPAPLLDIDQPRMHLAVPKVRSLSERVTRLAESGSAVQGAAQRIAEIAKALVNPDVTIYNWGDVASGELSILGDPGQRDYKLSGADIHHYLALSSERHRVIALYRGHQHLFGEAKGIDGRVVATTLPVGIDCAAYDHLGNLFDRAYIMRPAGDGQPWKKQTISRFKGLSFSTVSQSEDMIA